MKLYFYLKIKRVTPHCQLKHLKVLNYILSLEIKVLFLVGQLIKQRKERFALECSKPNRAIFRKRRNLVARFTFEAAHTPRASSFRRTSFISFIIGVTLARINFFFVLFVRNVGSAPLLISYELVIIISANKSR